MSLTTFSFYQFVLFNVMAWFASFMQVLILCLWLSLTCVYAMRLPAGLCTGNNRDETLLGKVGPGQHSLLPPNTMEQVGNFYF